ncbi:MAG: flagellar hook assembly protein FlgD [Caulobacteraceae bacterium]|nr:flagellar hook assembly protein FlgD [Caulobacter sp.]
MTTAVTSPTTTTTPATGSASATGTQADLASGVSNLSTGYQTFLTLLTTQLKNQDPTSPLDTNQFTQQLVQMTGVQQQLLSNQLLQQLVNQSGSGQGATGAVGLIGKTVTASQATANLAGGKVAWSYALDNAASSATLTVKNAAGTVVWSGAAPDLSAGSHAFTWNGQDSSGRQLADGGAYTLSITAADASGGAVAATPQITGVVSSVQTVAGQTVVQVGGATAPVSSITSVAAAS